MGERTTEFVLGILGGIFGLLGALAGLFIGSVGGALGAAGASTVTGLAAGAAILAIIGIVGAALVKSRTKLAGALMLISAIGGFIAIFLFYLIGAVLLFIAGVMALRGK